MIEGYEYLDYIIDNIVDEVPLNTDEEFEAMLKELVEDVRLELSNRYKIHACDSDNYHYQGLCDEACRMIDYILSNVSVRIFKKTKGKVLGVLHRHGEQKHSPVVTESKNWPLQHSWLIVKYDNEKWYVDATCQQFGWLYDDIPDLYVSKEPPRWFYDDRDNPAWNGITKKINNMIVIPRRINNSNVYVKDGLIEFIQYEIWGRISDYIRRKELARWNPKR